MGNDRICHQQGFTLLEILIATTILAATLAVLFPAMSTAQRHQDSVRSRSQALLVAQSVLAGFEADVGGALGDTLSKETVLNGTASGLRWTASFLAQEPRTAEISAYRVSVAVSPSVDGEPVTLSTVVIGRPVPEAR